MDLSSLPPLHGQTLKDARSSVELGGGAFSIAGYGLLSERDTIEDATLIRSFNENDGEEAVKCLRKCFQVLNPGNHIGKRCPEHGSISFVHCRHITQLGKRYLHLRELMEERARIDLLRDCVSRIKLSTTFVRDLQELVSEEHRVLYTITHDCVQEIPITKLFCLNALCEDLRTQIGHWNCIKQKLHTNRWLQPILGSLYFQLDRVKRTLNLLRDKAIWWLEKFVFVGLQVFAHGNVEEVTHEMIWNITRGLEDLNNIVNGLQNGSHKSTSHNYIGSYGRLKQFGKGQLDPDMTNTLSNMGENVRAIPFSRVLSLLAKERSKYAALETHRFFTTNSEFVKLLYSGKLPNYVWSEDVSNSSVDRQDRDTSDYHTATGSMTSLSAAVLKIGSIRAPDLSNNNSPLVELSRREHAFAEQFLLIVCSSTNLLRKNDAAKSRRPVKASVSMCSTKPQSMSSAKPPRSDTPVMSRSDSLRKSVSWGDSADSSIRSQLISRYMDLYWSHFGGSLQEMFYEPSWVRQKSLYYSDIGSLLIHNTTIVALVKHMIQHVCLKGALSLLRLPNDPIGWDPGVPLLLSECVIDLFPPGSVTPMLNAAKKCLHIAAFGAWDTCMCESLASQVSDKCYPCPLVNGDYSTRTGMLLRDTYQPMLHILREHLSDAQDTPSNGSVCTLNEMVSLTMRLAATSGVAFSWCRTKVHQYLASMSVANFLLISQTDLKILIDETQCSLYHIQQYSKSTGHKSEPSAGTSLTQMTKQLNVVLDGLQGFPGLCMKQFSLNCTSSANDYFKENMPTGKVWKKKQEPADHPVSHNIYIEHVLETVLEPVLEGVGKLKQTVQLSVISLSTEALCQAWLNFILTEKIKFSFVGACQLGHDVKYLRSWLQQSIVSEPVRQSILDLAVLKNLQGAVLLLLKQPSKRPASMFRDSHRENSVDSVTDGHLQGERSIHESEECISHVANPQDWLALRVQGGGRGWRGLSSCLSNDS